MVEQGVTVKLGDLAHARSGDKGDSANIGVIAYSDKGYELLKERLTAERVAAYFAPLNPVEVARYELPLLGAFNFVLRSVLAGGGSRSLRVDAQGKALGVALLEMPFRLTQEEYSRCVRTGANPHEK